MPVVRRDVLFVSLLLALYHGLLTYDTHWSSSSSKVTEAVFLLISSGGSDQHASRTIRAPIIHDNSCDLFSFSSQALDSPPSHASSQVRDICLFFFFFNLILLS